MTTTSQKQPSRRRKASTPLDRIPSSQAVLRRLREVETEAEQLRIVLKTALAIEGVAKPQEAKA